ncbi:MAG: ABC transporter permease [Alphaproteobacteria bacterium]
MLSERDKKGRFEWKGLFTFRGGISRPMELSLAVASFTILLVFWVALAESGLIREAYLPSPIRVAIAMYTLFAEFNFIKDVYISILRVMIAFTIAALMAIPLGILMNTYRIIGATHEPVMDLIRYLPVPALVPLTVIWLGIGETSKIALLWMGTFFQLVLLIADAARRVPGEYVEICYTLGAKTRHVLRWIILPAMAPTMVDNLRITLGWCWSYVIIAEIVAANEGIGHVIWISRRFGKMPEVMAGVLAIGFIGLASDQLIRYFHRRAFRYLE